MNAPADSPSPGGSPPAWMVILAFTAIYTSWGTTFLAIQWGVRDEALPPALFGGSRVAAAGFLLLAYQMLRGRSLRLAPSELAGMIGVSWLLFVGGNWLMNLAEKWVDSGVAAVLTATTPLWLGLFAMFWPNEERLTLRGWAGLLIGLGGVLILLAPRLHDVSAFVQDLSPLLVLGSGCCWALGSLFSRHLPNRTSHLTRAGYQMALGGTTLTLLGIAMGELHQLPAAPTLRAVGVYIYLIVVGSLVGFVAFNWLLGHVSAAKVGTYSYVNPVIAVLIGWLAGETIDGWVLCGITTILLGVFLVRSGERPALAEGMDATPDEAEIASSGQVVASARSLD